MVERPSDCRPWRIGVSGNRTTKVARQVETKSSSPELSNWIITAFFHPDPEMNHASSLVGLRAFIHSFIQVVYCDDANPLSHHFFYSMSLWMIALIAVVDRLIQLIVKSRWREFSTTRITRKKGSLFRLVGCEGKHRKGRRRAITWCRTLWSGKRPRSRRVSWPVVRDYKSIIQLERKANREDRLDRPIRQRLRNESDEPQKVNRRPNDRDLASVAVATDRSIGRLSKWRRPSLNNAARRCSNDTNRLDLFRLVGPSSEKSVSPAADKSRENRMRLKVSPKNRSTKCWTATTTITNLWRRRHRYFVKWPSYLMSVRQ